MNGMNDLPLADEMNYWKTSKSSAESWLSKASDMIEKHGGTVYLSAKGKHLEQTAFCIEFNFDNEHFRSVWPVLNYKYRGDDKAAERQAATMLFYDIKNRCMKMAIFGARASFFDMLRLPDGRTAGQLANENLVEYSAQFLLGVDK